jgi:hypothetical protein
MKSRKSTKSRLYGETDGCLHPVAVAKPKGGAPKGNRNAKRHGMYSDEGRALRACLSQARQAARLGRDFLEMELALRRTARLSRPS